MAEGVEKLNGDAAADVEVVDAGAAVVDEAPNKLVELAGFAAPKSPVEGEAVVAAAPN